MDAPALPTGGILPYWCVRLHLLGSQAGDKRTRTAGIRHRVSYRLSDLPE